MCNNYLVQNPYREDLSEVKNLSEVKKSILSVLKDHKKEGMDIQYLESNQRLDYFVAYLNNKLKVKTIVYELDYVEKDYLGDYSHYYSRSFRPYSRHCIRLHFFTNKFVKEEFESHLLEPEKEQKEYQDAYAGFMVLRPLPLTVIGKTCLIPPPETNETSGEPSSYKDFYPVVREYRIHLFNLNFRINSIAFKEQDGVLFACASVALYVAFQKTGKLFKHSRPTPATITRKASEVVVGNPSEGGLSPQQMAYVIQEQGILEPLMDEPKEFSGFKASLYAYLRGGIPVILGAKIYEGEKVLGFHALTVTGYRHSPTAIEPYYHKGGSKPKTPPLFLESSAITTLYVHDDQKSCFFPISVDPKYRGYYSPNFHWVMDEGRDMKAYPTLLLIPLYYKIRVPFKHIFAIISDFSSFIYEGPGASTIVWDIYLTTICELRETFSKYVRFLPSSIKGVCTQLLTSNFPRYIWVADAHSMDGKRGNNMPDYSLYFDATDITQSDLFLLGIHLMELSYCDIKENFNEKGKVDAAGIYQPLLGEGLSEQIKKIALHYCCDTPNETIGQGRQVPTIISPNRIK
jgi:hypothetical protein